jgi:ribosomal protein S6E (S10)
MSDVAAAPEPSATPPDRLSTEEHSPHYNAAVLERGIGVRFKGVEKTNVEEYCVSEGWVRLVVGTGRDRAGKPMTMKVSGSVEPYFRDVPPKV